MMIRQSVRTLRTFQVFRAAYKLYAGEQRYTARQQHREATQIHVPLPAGLRRRGVPSGNTNPLDAVTCTRRRMHAPDLPRHG
ncbi:hypothetical protein ALC57_01858 [Trachymyrmex cornetzi]|uniref:Uncharacterized protein n=1 Tax=Trachymyrmex cornetzi TaxID=471704 RepID=A0A195ELZ0_9HYME|nr:hypothetical protein ALC57_01858 [Trachymyrmex cornetzi]